MKQFLFNRLPVIAVLFLSTGLFAQTSIAPSYVYAKLEYYKNHFSQPPVAIDGVIVATHNGIVTGNVIADHKNDGKSLTAYLMEGSADGKVDLSANGAFTFTPNDNFTGRSTTFSYKVCDNALCSETATITINFPAASTSPVMLTELMASVNENNNVSLNWSTSAEINNDRFEVERSTDGTHFTKVGIVKGQGTSNIAHNYAFINKVSRQTASKNDLYYRLRQVTIDGQATTSKVLIVRVYKTKALQALSLTPNAERNDIKINAQLNESSYVVMKVVNDAGTEVMRQSVKSPQGINSYTLAGSDQLEKGTYFLEMIVNSNERMMVKLMKN